MFEIIIGSLGGFGIMLLIVYIIPKAMKRWIVHEDYK